MPPVFPAFRPDGSLDHASVTRAAALLRAGRLVAFPTETVYGLGAHALDARAVRSIFEAKGRPSFNPLIVHVPSAADAAPLVRAWPTTARLLAEAFWPGPLTLVVPKSEVVPDVVTGGLDSVAVRVPSHPVARALLVVAGVPVAAPSANRFTGVSPTLAAHVVASLGDRVDAVLDSGACEVGLESTVVDLTGSRPRLLRPGGVSAEALRRVVGALDEAHVVQDEGARLSPGLLSKHYAPQGETRLFTRKDLARALAGVPAGARVGLVLRSEEAMADDRVVVRALLPDEPEGYGRGLYAALHEVDAAGCTHVLIEAAPADESWAAVRDRVERAAG